MFITEFIEIHEYETGLVKVLVHLTQ